MNPKSMRMLIAGAAVVLALALLLVLRPGDSNDEPASTPMAVDPTEKVTGPTGPTAVAEPRQSKPAAPEVPEIKIVGGEPVGGVQELEVDEGEPVRFIVRSDVEDEVHVHGFDVSEPVGPGSPARFDFKAGFTGVFEIELENSAVPIIELQVNP